MGGTSSSSQSSSSTLTPYQPAAGYMNGILGSLGNLAGSAGTLNSGQSNAINTIENNATSQPNYSVPIASGTYGLLNGGGATANDGAIKSNLTNFQNGIVGQTASGANIGKNAALQSQLDTVAADTSSNINSQWAAAGRDGSPGNAQAVARGVMQAEAPIIAQQYNTDTTNAINAANAEYNAGNSTYGILNGNQNTANTNFENGITAVGNGVTAQNTGANAELEAASKATGLPISQLTTLLGAISPVAAQFGTQNGTAQGTQTMSGAQQFATIGSGLNSWGNFLFGS